MLCSIQCSTIMNNTDLSSLVKADLVLTKLLSRVWLFVTPWICILGIFKAMSLALEKIVMGYVYLWLSQIMPSCFPMWTRPPAVCEFLPHYTLTKNWCHQWFILATEGWLIVSHWVIIFISLISKELICICMLIDHLYFFFGKVPIQVFCPLFMVIISYRFENVFKHCGN